MAKTTAHKKTSPQQKQNQAIVVGGGAVGLVGALILAQNGVQVVLLEAAKAEQARATPQDLRATALNRQSHSLLESLGVMQELTKAGVALQPINAVQVREGKLGTAKTSTPLVFGGQNQPVGTMVRNQDLLPALWQQVLATQQIQVHFGSRVVAFDTLRNDNRAEVVLENNLALRASLVIAADGKNSALRNLAGIASRTSEYGQSALLGTLSHSKPHRGVAEEIFLPEGALAFLPLPASKPQQTQQAGGLSHRSAFVWNLQDEFVAPVRESPQALLPEIFAPLVGKRLGEIQIHNCETWTLSLTRAKHFTAPHLALVGDAARAIHPVAGQGLNLAFRDLHDLQKLVRQAQEKTLPLGDAGLLAQFASRRARDSLALTAFTDGMVRLFAARTPPIPSLRRAGLAAVQRSSKARSFFLSRAGSVSFGDTLSQ